MFALENICVPCYRRNIVGNFDSLSLPNSGDFDDKILKMSKFPWVARTKPPPPLRGKTFIGALAVCQPCFCPKVTNATDLKYTSQLEFYRNFIITINCIK
jgi:hypothetical protein